MSTSGSDNLLLVNLYCILFSCTSRLDSVIYNIIGTLWKCKRIVCAVFSSILHNSNRSAHNMVFYFCIDLLRLWFNRWDIVTIFMMTDKWTEFIVACVKITVHHDVTFGDVSSDLSEVIENRSFLFRRRLYRNENIKSI